MSSPDIFLFPLGESDAGDHYVFQTGSHIPEGMIQNNGKGHGKIWYALGDVGDRSCSWQG